MVFSLAFDGSAEGVPEELDLDGAGQRSDFVMLLSFDAIGSVGGATFDDEDVLAFDPFGPSRSLYYDGPAAHSALVAADVTAVPEPGALLQLCAGGGLLAVLARPRGCGDGRGPRSARSPAAGSSRWRGERAASRC